MVDGRHCATWQFLVTGTMRHFECNMPIILTDIVIYAVVDVFQCTLEAVTVLKVCQQQLTKGWFRSLLHCELCHLFDLLKV